MVGSTHSLGLVHLHTASILWTCPFGFSMGLGRILTVLATVTQETR